MYAAIDQIIVVVMQPFEPRENACNPVEFAGFFPFVSNTPIPRKAATGLLDDVAPRAQHARIEA